MVVSFYRNNDDISMRSLRIADNMRNQLIYISIELKLKIPMLSEFKLMIES